MGTPFKMYQVSLEYFYHVLGSSNKSVIEKAFQYLEQDFRFWEVPELDVVIPAYQKHLDNLINEGNDYNCAKPFPVPKEVSKVEDSENFTQVSSLLVDTFVAIFSTHPSFAEYGQSSVYNFKAVFRYLITHTPYNDDVLPLYNFLMLGRPVLKEEVNDYTYIRNEEMPIMLKNLATYHNDNVIEATKKTLESALARAYATSSTSEKYIGSDVSKEARRKLRESTYSEYTRSNWPEPKYIAFFDYMYSFERVINEIYNAGYDFFARADL